MSRLFDFERISQSGVIWHVMTADDATTPEPHWPGLWEQEYPDDPELNPYWRYAVNNQDGEAMAVWRALAWCISGSTSRAVLPRYDRDHVADMLVVPRQHVSFVDWEYHVDYESETFVLADRGFVPARSSIPIRPEPSEWERQHAGKAGLFRVRTLNEFHRADAGVSFDVASELSLFGGAGDTFAELQRSLSCAARPELADVLGNAGVLSHLTIVRDRFVGLHSYFCIAARRDLTDELADLTHIYDARWDVYRRDMPPRGTFEEFVAGMEILLSPTDSSPTTPLPRP